MLPYIFSHSFTIFALIKEGRRVCSVNTFSNTKAIYSLPDWLITDNCQLGQLSIAISYSPWVTGMTFLRIILSVLKWRNPCLKIKWLLLPCWVRVDESQLGLLLVSSSFTQWYLGCLFPGIDGVLPLFAPGRYCSFLLHHTCSHPLAEATNWNKAYRTV